MDVLSLVSYPVSIDQYLFRLHERCAIQRGVATDGRITELGESCCGGDAESQHHGRLQEYCVSTDALFTSARVCRSVEICRVQVRPFSTVVRLPLTIMFNIFVYCALEFTSLAI